MTRRIALLITALCLASAARAATRIEFHDIAWPRHNKHTGNLEWILRADKALPQPNDRYRCTRPRLKTFKLVKTDEGTRSRRELSLEADEGTYVWAADESEAHLAGNVKAYVYTEEPIAIRTESASLKSTWTEAEAAAGEVVTKQRVISSRARVEVRSRTRTLTGRGMVFRDETLDEPQPDGTRRERRTVSKLTVHRDPCMTLREGGGAAALPSILSGPAEDPAEPPKRVVIKTDGPLVLDRLANVARFRAQAPGEKVVLTRGTGPTATSLACRVLTLYFTRRGAGENEELALKRMLAEKQVTYAGKDPDGRSQTFAGERFEWDPAVSVGTLAGGPATMQTSGMRARAPIIKFNQEKNLIRCSRGARLVIDFRPE
ncbi:MAG: hypothetical protein ACOC8E_03905 [Planctomycetota bacterium]